MACDVWIYTSSFDSVCTPYVSTDVGVLHRSRPNRCFLSFSNRPLISLQLTQSQETLQEKVRLWLCCGDARSQEVKTANTEKLLFNSRRCFKKWVVLLRGDGDMLICPCRRIFNKTRGLEDEVFKSRDFQI